MTRATYDRLSRWYDFLAASEQRFVRLGVERLAPQPGESILEIGPGTGHALATLARAVGPTGHVTGVDLSPGMLGRASSRLSRAGLEGQVRLLCADAARLPLPGSSFDAAFLSFTLELFDAPTMALVLGEIRRVLRPTGRLAVVALASEGGSRRMLRLYRWAHTRFPDWIDCRPILPARLLQEGGYRVLELLRQSLWGLPVQIVRAVPFPEPVGALLQAAMLWATARPDILALFLVGSQARGTATSTSDVDLVLVAADPGPYLSDPSWLRAFGQPASVESEDWGMVQALRARYAGGLEVELGVTTRAWLAPPLDEGARRVLADGYRLLFDRDGWAGAALGFGPV